MRFAKLVLFTLLAFSPSAFAKPHALTATSLDQLKAEAQKLERTLANAGDCEFKVEETRDGLTLRIRDSRHTNAYLDVPAEAAISLEEELLGGDGSAARIFTIIGQGSLRLVHANDAFERAELTDRDGRLLSCELDL